MGKKTKAPMSREAFALRYKELKETIHGGAIVAAFGLCVLILGGVGYLQVVKDFASQYPVFVSIAGLLLALIPGYAVFALHRLERRKPQELQDKTSTPAPANQAPVKPRNYDSDAVLQLARLVEKEAMQVRHHYSGGRMENFSPLPTIDARLIAECHAYHEKTDMPAFMDNSFGVGQAEQAHGRTPFFRLGSTDSVLSSHSACCVRDTRQDSGASG